MTETSTTTIDRPLGLDVRNPNNPYLRQVGVIGSIETTSTGNTVLRVGPTLDSGDGWEQKAMVVLTPAERELLIAALIAHREVSS